MSFEECNVHSGVTTPTHGARSPELGRAYVALPWASAERPNRRFEQCRTRDQQTSKKLTPELRTLYNETIEVLVRDGYATRIEEAEGKHFISVRPVFDVTRSTTKCRLCLDARGLNRYIHPGPPPPVTVVKALLHFRKYKFIKMTEWHLRRVANGFIWTTSAESSAGLVKLMSVTMDPIKILVDAAQSCLIDSFRLLNVTVCPNDNPFILSRTADKRVHASTLVCVLENANQEFVGRRSGSYTGTLYYRLGV